MLNYIPKPYPGEVFKSVESRFHVHTLSKSISQTKSLLFGNREVNTSWYFPIKLNYFIKQTSDLLPMGIKCIIDELTLWPFFKHFIKKEKHKLILDVMKKGGHQGTSASIGINGSGFFLSEMPKYCPSCNKDNMKSFGELFWMRVHQIPNITVCQIHNCFLEECLKLENSPFKITIDTPSSQTCPVIEPRLNSNTHLLAISKFMVEILDDKAILDFDYRTQANKLGYMNRGMIDQIQLQKDINSFYGEDILEHFFPSQGLKKPKFVSTQLINEGHKILHPTRHILLQYFFKEANPKQKKQVPFQNLLENPHTCKNPTCPGFQIQTCKGFDFQFARKRDTSIGYYKCSCGMVYTHGIKLVNRNLREFFRVKTYGHVWNSTFIQKYKSKCSQRELAAQLDIHPDSIKNHAIRLGLIKVTLNPNKIVAKVRRKNEAKKVREGVFKSKRKIKRERFIELYKLNHGSQIIRKSELGRIINWLRVNDPVWLQSHYKKIPVRKNQKSNREIQEIDRECLRKLRNAHQQLLLNKDCKRITKSQIVLQAKIGAKHLKLPQCQKFLERNQESTQEFQIRRLKNVAEKLSAKGEKITMGRLFFDAHVWKRTDKVVDAAARIASHFS